VSLGPSPALSGTIEVRGIRAYGKHGANPGEREADQPFVVDVVLHLDLVVPCGSDELSDTLDYAAVAARVSGIVRDRSFRLLERLAGELLSDLMRDERVDSATVGIAKPGVLAGATPAVTVSFDRRERAER